VVEVWEVLLDVVVLEVVEGGEREDEVWVDVDGGAEEGGWKEYGPAVELFESVV
jgi:hypothetical protein